jgi:hypothetical protein
MGIRDLDLDTCRSRRRVCGDELYNPLNEYASDLARRVKA